MIYHTRIRLCKLFSQTKQTVFPVRAKSSLWEEENDPRNCLLKQIMSPWFTECGVSYSASSNRANKTNEFTYNSTHLKIFIVYFLNFSDNVVLVLNVWYRHICISVNLQWGYTFTNKKIMSVSSYSHFKHDKNVTLVEFHSYVTSLFVWHYVSIVLVL